MIDEDENECLPVPRRSLINRITNHFGSDNETSPSSRRQSRIFLNTSTGTDSGVDENIRTPVQLITLYEQTVELTAKNKINAKNAFRCSLIERLPEIIDLIAFDDKIDSFDDHYHEPNFVKAGSVIDTSAKIYGYRVDALHAETQKLNGTFQDKDGDEEELNRASLDPIETPKQITSRNKIKKSSYLATDLTTISLSYEFEFHPFQPSNLCQWPGGIGADSLYADMISYTMYSSSDYPLVNGFINLNNQINKEYDDNERILDITMKTIYDLIPLRDVIKDYEEENHILGCQTLREFSFNEDSTESYIETINECSVIDSSLISLNDGHDIPNEIFNNDFSEVRDDISNYYFQELRSAHTFPTTMVSMDVTLLQSKMSFADHIPQLLRDKNDSSEYSYFDSTKLKLFAGPYLWKYTNVLPDMTKSIPVPEEKTLRKSTRIRSTHYFKLDLFNEEKNQSLNELMSLDSWTRKSLKKSKRKILSTTLRKSSRFHLHNKNEFQLRLSRKLRPLIDLSNFNYFPDYNPEILSNYYTNYSTNNDENYNFEPSDHNNSFPEQIQYEFNRPTYYDKIEFDKNFAKIDAKKLQIQLYDEYNHENINSTTPISLSTLCINLIDQGIISYEKDQIVSAFYYAIDEGRLNSYKDLAKELHCLYELHYSVNGLSLHEYTSQCIQLFLKQIPLYQTYFLTKIRAILKQSAISINIRHLAFITDINIDNEDLNDLKRLPNYNDIEIDFFHNITHVQNHRCYRALKRFKLMHDQQPFHLTTINNYLLPIVCSFINDVINDEIVLYV
ncbi:unnamed protein product [Adineta steineri]|uniref:Condensin complex subunit 2 n=1 Tax=Adineta steineri TaxID=433720 RepID=A0A818LU07_9BILA|nr:unnamed protein product [Adineta steineri]